MKTCWYLIALMPTGATPNERRKCSGNACNAALRHFRYNWQKGGQIHTEMPVKVSGFKQPIDDAEWTITTLTHTVSPDNGFTTSLELEVRIDDFEME